MRTLVGPCRQRSAKWSAFAVRVLVAVITIVGMATVPPVAHAGDGPGGVRGDAIDLLRVLPAEATLGVVIDDADRLLSSVAGRGATEWIASAADFERTRAGWESLVEQLRLDEAEARRRLLGTRFAIVLGSRSGDGSGRARHERDDRGDGDTPDGAWALAGVVDRETAELLRERLDLSLREVQGGRPVLFSQSGELQVVVARADELTRVGPRGGDGVERVLFIAGPRRASWLADGVTRALGGGGAGTLASAEASRYLARLERGVGFAMIAPGLIGNEPSRGLAVAGSLVDGGRSLRLVAVYEQPRHQRESGVGTRAEPATTDHDPPKPQGADERPPRPARHWSASTFAAFADGAAVAVIDSSVAFELASAVLQGKERAGAPAVVRAAMERTLEGRLALAVYPARAADGEATRFEAAVGFESADRVAALREFDGLISSLAAAGGATRSAEAEQRAETRGTNAAAPDLGGSFPDAVRAAPLASVFGPVGELDGMQAFGDAPDIGWTSRVSDAADTPAEAGWLLVGLADAERLLAVGAALSGEAGRRAGDGRRERPAPWVSMGVVRLSALAAVTGEMKAEHGASGGSGERAADRAGRDADSSTPEGSPSLHRVSWRAVRLNASLVAGEVELAFRAASAEADRVSEVRSGEAVPLDWGKPGDHADGPWSTGAAGVRVLEIMDEQNGGGG